MKQQGRRFSFNMLLLLVLIIASVQADPRGVADYYRAYPNTPLNVAAPGVLSNDIDIPVEKDTKGKGPSVLVSLGQEPSDGTVILNSDGSFVFTPPTNFTGFVRFSYFLRFGKDQVSGETFVGINIVAACANPCNELFILLGKRQDFQLQAGGSLSFINSEIKPLLISWAPFQSFVLGIGGNQIFTLNIPGTILYKITYEDDPTGSLAAGKIRVNPSNGPAAGSLGASCDQAGDCDSGFCVDGICCESRCDSKCKACTYAKTGGQDGQCLFVPHGKDPNEECDYEDASTCGTTGYCDGEGGCALYHTGTQCVQGGCTDDNTVSELGSKCDGEGTCVPLGNITCCPYACTDDVCVSSCEFPSDCCDGYQCLNSRCVLGKSNGVQCKAKSECLSTFCVDGVCCDTICNGTCHSCSASRKGAGFDGECGFTAAGIDPQGSCENEDSTTCGTNGACDGSGACSIYPVGTSCSTPTCEADNTLSGVKVCAGPHDCGAATTQNCCPFACSGSSCNTVCSNNTDCCSGYYCTSSGDCQTSLTQGTACTASSQCESGFCADGVCCDTACDSQCHACTAALKGSGSDGTCGAIQTGTDDTCSCPTGSCSAGICSTIITM